MSQENAKTPIFTFESNISPPPILSLNNLQTPSSSSHTPKLHRTGDPNIISYVTNTQRWYYGKLQNYNKKQENGNLV